MRFNLEVDPLMATESSPPIPTSPLEKDSEVQEVAFTILISSSEKLLENQPKRKDPVWKLGIGCILPALPRSLCLRG